MGGDKGNTTNSQTQKMPMHGKRKYRDTNFSEPGFTAVVWVLELINGTPVNRTHVLGGGGGGRREREEDDRR